MCQKFTGFETNHEYRIQEVWQEEIMGGLGMACVQVYAECCIAGVGNYMLLCMNHLQDGISSGVGMVGIHKV